MKISKPIRTWFVCFFTILTILTMQAFAAGSVDTERPVSVTVEFKNSENIALQGVDFRLYRVADVSAAGEYTWKAAYGNPADVLKRDMTNEELTELVDALSTKITENPDIKPVQTGVTDANGILTFTTDTDGRPLTAGMYLLLGSARRVGNGIYTPIGTLVQVPITDMTQNVWVYEIEVAPKPTYVYDPPQDDDDDDTPPDDTPIDDEPTPLSDGFDPPTVDIIDGDTPLGGVLDIFDEMVPRDLLPATGTLWWLVPILAYVGIFLFVTGLYQNRKSGNDEEF